MLLQAAQQACRAVEVREHQILLELGIGAPVPATPLLSVRAGREPVVSKTEGRKLGWGLNVIPPSIHPAGAPASPGLKAKSLLWPSRTYGRCSHCVK